jgi:ADP-heptose:LPS heptosyltransferase
MELIENSLINVIAIKLPFDLQDRILTFPFLHAISEFYPKADIHLITPKINVEILNLLPFKAYYHLFEEDEFKTIMDVHPYTANSNIYNVDLFISLTNSFVDACLGVGLRAKIKAGFLDDWKTLVLTHKIKRPIGHHVVEDYMALFETITGVKSDSRMRVTSRPLVRMIEDKKPYLAINLSPLREASIESEWIDLISQFEGQKIILFASDEQVRVKLLIDNFLAMLPRKNTYETFFYKDLIELARMLAFSDGLISYSGAGAALAAYVGTRSLILFDNEDPQKTGPFYSLADVSIMGVNNPTLVNTSKDNKIVKNRTTFNMNEVFGQAHSFFKL